MDRSQPVPSSPTGDDEPAQTDLNSDTVLAGERLLDDGSRPKIGAIPSSYGAPGGSAEPERSS